MLGKIIIDDQDVLALFHKIFGDRRAAVGRDPLQRCEVARQCGYDDGIIHRAVLFEVADDLGDGGRLLTDRDVNADHVLTLLVDHRVNGDRGLARLPVADDQLALSASDREHGVDREDSGLERLRNALSHTNAGSLGLDREIIDRFHSAESVDGIAERVNDASDHALADGNAGSLAGAYHLRAFI